MTVSPNGGGTEVWFDWGEGSSLNFITGSQTVPPGGTSVPVSMTLGGLACNRTYSFRAKADNSASPSPVSGATRTFQTTACGGGGTQTLDLIQNGDFLDDDDHWTLSGDFHADDRFGSHNFGPGYAYLSEPDGSAGNSLNGTIYQQVTIRPTLSRRS